jgi:AraC-like DNA-binding protein
MPHTNLQKSADANKNDAVPKEVLNPNEAAKMYTFRMYPPSHELADFVDYYWIMRWDFAGRPPFLAEVIPSPYTNLTFMPEGARITGVTTGKYTYELKDKGAIIGAKFKPGGLHVFFGKSVHELTDTVVPASSVFSDADDAYSDAMLNLPNAEAVARVEALLKAASPKTDKHLSLITRILTYLEANERPTLATIVQEFNVSERRLQEIFREYVGVGLKWIMLRARLIKAVELAAALKHANWTIIAQDLGYSDQSHFINDFKRVIGKTPAQYTTEIQ